MYRYAFTYIFSFFFFSVFQQPFTAHDWWHSGKITEKKLYKPGQYQNNYGNIAGAIVDKTGDYVWVLGLTFACLTIAAILVMLCALIDAKKVHIDEQQQYLYLTLFLSERNDQMEIMMYNITAVEVSYIKGEKCCYVDLLLSFKIELSCGMSFVISFHCHNNYPSQQHLE